ncbi:MAG: isoprenylcysteine carboxylmethyltransferase family protein [Prolixibacteraceae bacterium]
MVKKFVLKVVLIYPVFIVLFLFLPAGSFRYWEAWLYAVVLFIPMVTTITYLAKNDPDLLERRMRLKEKEEKQKLIVRFFRLPFLLGFIIPGFDFRYNWSEVPTVIVLIANLLVLLGYLFVLLVFRKNTYTSRIVEVEKDQKVITTGPYAIIRHPMYAGSILLFLATPLALGSWWAFLMFGLLPVVLIFRILDEERVLKKDLPGYQEYCQKVRYRLIPFIW